MRADAARAFGTVFMSALSLALSETGCEAWCGSALRWPDQPTCDAPACEGCVECIKIRRQRVMQAFAEHGLLLHRFGWTDWESRTLAAETIQEVPVDTDCGTHCSAFSYIHPRLPVEHFTGFGPATIHVADPDLWSHVQCAAVTDSDSANRACCACFQPSWCPWSGISKNDSGYCRECDDESERCKALAAGCGVNLVDLKRRLSRDDSGVITCTARDVRAGTCKACTRALWCDDGNGGGPWAHTPAVSAAGFTRRYVYVQPQYRQCKWKGSQLTQFVDASIRFYGEVRKKTSSGHRRHPQVHIWNELNMYVGMHTQPALARTLVGILWANPGFKYGHDYGSFLGRLSAHLSNLKGRPIPVFTIGMERDALDWWEPGLRVVDLHLAPHNFTECPRNVCPSHGASSRSSY